MNLNNITAEYKKTKYCEEKHLTINIDGKLLDEILEENSPNSRYLGLVPTLLDWLEDEEEKNIVWSRIIPNINETTIAPILMCPDDLDFYCTIIVAHIKSSEDKIIWEKIGIDITDDEDYPNSLGKTVKWFEEIGPFSFNRDEYIKFVNKFKENI